MVQPRQLYNQLLALHRLPTIVEVARLTGLSTATLRRRFLVAGMTYRELVGRIRFDAAEKLLRNDNLSIKDIAYEVGYSGTSNFVRAFHRMTATTPAGYRRRLSS